MNLSAMVTPLADQVICALLGQGLLTAQNAENAQDVVEEAVEKSLTHFLSDAVAADLTNRIEMALRALTGPNGMEQAVAQNRRNLGLPPQCIFCDCAPDQHRDYVPPAQAAAQP